MNARWFVGQQERGGMPPERREMERGSPDSMVTSTQSDDQALCDAPNVGHNALVDARWAGGQQERGGMLLKRREMKRDFPDSQVTSTQPDGQALCDALNVGHTALVNARWFVDQGSAVECF